MSKVIVNTNGLSREEWLAYRRKGLGGSDASTVCGLNPYSCKLTLWADKTGRLPEKEDTEAMRTGRDLEDYVSKSLEKMVSANDTGQLTLSGDQANNTVDYITKTDDADVISVINIYTKNF